MGEVVWSEQAIGNLDDIVAYVEQHDPAAAEKLQHRIAAAAENLRDFPHRGRPVSALGRELVSVPPYIIRYRVDADEVTILHVRHGRQQVCD